MQCAVLCCGHRWKEHGHLVFTKCLWSGFPCPSVDAIGLWGLSLWYDNTVQQGRVWFPGVSLPRFGLQSRLFPRWQMATRPPTGHALPTMGTETLLPVEGSPPRSLLLNLGRFMVMAEVTPILRLSHGK